MIVNNFLPIDRDLVKELAAKVRQIEYDYCKSCFIHETDIKLGSSDNITRLEMYLRPSLDEVPETNTKEWFYEKVYLQGWLDKYDLSMKSLDLVCISPHTLKIVLEVTGMY